MHTCVHVCSWACMLVHIFVKIRDQPLTPFLRTYLPLLLVCLLATLKQNLHRARGLPIRQTEGFVLIVLSGVASFAYKELCLTLPVECKEFLWNGWKFVESLSFEKNVEYLNPRKDRNKATSRTVRISLCGLFLQNINHPKSPFLLTEKILKRGPDWLSLFTHILH